MKHCLKLALLALVGWAAHAGTSDTPSREAEKISKLMVGDWLGDVSIQAGKQKEQKLTSRLNARPLQKAQVSIAN